MESSLKKAYSPEFFRKKGHEIIDLLADYLDQCFYDENSAVSNWKEPKKMVKEFKLNFYESRDSDIRSFFDKVLHNSIHIHHPHFIGHQIAPTLPTAALSDLLSSLLNNGSAIYEMGAASAAMDKNVINMICEKIGYKKQSDGVFTSGGSLGNLTALLAARQSSAKYNIWEKGNDSENQLGVMVSEEAHYCISKNLKIMGLGEDGVIKIPVNEKFQIDTDTLEEYYSKSRMEGIQIIAVVGNACSTATGSHDNLNKIADFCEKNDLWFHVDAAHGGAALFSDKYKHLLHGISRADSVVIDFHKMLMAPALNTAIVFKDGSKSYETFAQKAYYLWDKKEEKDWFNMANRTFECTKSMIGLKVYTMLKVFGTQLFSDYVNALYDLGKIFGEIIQKTEKFELATEPESNIICFRYAPEGKNTEDLNLLNSGIRKFIVEEGSFYIVQTQIKDKIYLRTTIMNPFTSKKDLKELLSWIITISNKIK